MTRLFVCAGLLGLAVIANADYDFYMTGDESTVWYSVGGFGTGYWGSMGPHVNGWTAGGNPGGFIEVTNNWGTGYFESGGEFTEPNWRFTPTAEDFPTTITLTVDVKKVKPDGYLQLSLGQIPRGYVVRIPMSDIATGQWVTVSKTFTANDFCHNNGLQTNTPGSLDPNLHPNFGLYGSLISLLVGCEWYRTGNGSAGSDSVYFDNAHIHVSTVPEPLTSSVLGLGLLAFLVRRPKK